MDEVISAGPCYSNDTLYVQENVRDFYNLCVNVRGCQASNSAGLQKTSILECREPYFLLDEHKDFSFSGWLTCEPAEMTPLAIFGTREAVAMILHLLLAFICLKELLKIECLLLSRWKGVPVFRDFAYPALLLFSSFSIFRSSDRFPL